MVSRACREIKTSKNLRKALEVILAIGNYMNGEGKRGGVWGFKLDTFEKLKRHKAADGKSTLLDFIITYFSENNKELINVGSIISTNMFRH